MSIREQLVIYDAVIRSKLMYGLESVNLTETLRKKIDVFHRKGLRQILKISTTYVQKLNHLTPTHDNPYILHLTNVIINTWEERRKGETEWGTQIFKQKKEIIWMSDYYEQMRRNFILQIINAEDDDPIKEIAINKETLTLK